MFESESSLYAKFFKQTGKPIDDFGHEQRIYADDYSNMVISNLNHPLFSLDAIWTKDSIGNVGLINSKQANVPSRKSWFNDDIDVRYSPYRAYLGFYDEILSSESYKDLIFNNLVTPQPLDFSAALGWKNLTYPGWGDWTNAPLWQKYLDAFMPNDFFNLNGVPTGKTVLDIK